MGGGAFWGGEGARGREIIYISLHCHHQNDSCIKIGGDESHFNVSLICEGQSHKTTDITVSINNNFLLRERRAEAKMSSRGPSAYQPDALPLGQTSSHSEWDAGFTSVNDTMKNH